MTRECRQCKVVKKLTSLHFLTSERKNKTYYTHVCRKCYNHNEIKLRKDRRNIFKPSRRMYFIRQAVIGHKEEPYYPGENFEYIAPTYAEIMLEYSL